jgi:16S rRNA pseudouridine516 synthase
MKIRLDKYLSNIGFCSRKETAKLAKKGLIKVNNEIVKKSDIKISLWDKIEVLWEEIIVKDKITVLLNKPSWYVSSDVDEGNYPSYKKLLENCIYKNMLNVAGRLDVDTEW